MHGQGILNRADGSVDYEGLWEKGKAVNNQFQSTTIGGDIASSSESTSFSGNDLTTLKKKENLESLTLSCIIINCDNDDEHTVYASPNFKSNPVRLYKKGQIIEIKANSQVINDNFTFVCLADDSGYMILNGLCNTVYLELINNSKVTNPVITANKSIKKYIIIKVDENKNFIVRSEPNLQGKIVKNYQLGILSLYLSIFISIYLTLIYFYLGSIIEVISNSAVISHGVIRVRIKFNI